LINQEKHTAWVSRNFWVSTVKDYKNTIDSNVLETMHMGFKKLARSVTLIVLMITTVATSASIIISPSLKAYAFVQSADLNSDQSMNRPPQQGTSERDGSGYIPSSQKSPTRGDSTPDESSRAQGTAEMDRPPIQITNQIVVQIGICVIVESENGSCGH
jgi:hypothetical protein